MTSCQPPKSQVAPYPEKASCPVDGNTYRRVGMRTLVHQIKRPWDQALPEQGYYFCDNPDCEVVYFGQDGMLIYRDDLRQSVGQKMSGEERVMCYCFDIKQRDFDKQHSLRDYVVQQTKDGSCDCAIRNPSGRCCLSDFPKV